ncbi:MAG: alpha-L-rhamnosidase N-terminal domain-containing protein, partial [Gemmatimonadaceae bacterium]
MAAIAVFPAAIAAQEPRVFDGAQRASWIAPSGVPGDSFTVFHARRTFDLTALPARFVVHVSADKRYRLYVNGVQVASGPQRSDVAHWRYETLDLAPNLHAGRNVIAALVWNWGAARPVAQFSNRTGFLLQGNSALEASLINTGAGWKLLRDPAYAPIVITSAFLKNYYAAAPGDSIDGSRYPWGWESTDYDDDRWSGAEIVGHMERRAMPPGGYGEVSGWQLEARSIPPMEETQQRLARVRRATGVETDGAFLRGAGDLVIPARTTATILLDQSHTTNAYPILETSGGAGSMVRLTYAEALLDSAGRKGNRNDIEGRTVRGVRDVFLPDGGAHRRFTPLYWRSFRYIQMEV